MARRRRRSLGNDGSLEGVLTDPSVAGPLLGGGVTQAASMATRMLFKKKPAMVKWSSAIGLLIGGGISTALLFTRHRQTGIAGLVTSALIAVPKQIEDLMAADTAAKAGYLGVITPEQELNGYGLGYDDSGYDMSGAGLGAEQDIQLLDAGSGSTGVLGVVTPERELSGAFGAGGIQNDVELMGGFGSNFLSSM